jgi:hypothetical protein
VIPPLMGSTFVKILEDFLDLNDGYASGSQGRQRISIYIACAKSPTHLTTKELGRGQTQPGCVECVRIVECVKEGREQEK